ncbi:thioredoxin family protein [Pectinatus cerevisiiphilus]|uniref:Thioredoxin n=1 Tax=Pectinatus cerevisiiphilus TaxID=86956 RepID=A0A4R3K6G7_9FIRM|nr:thioredoxin family protein [Pectinatus cerevisiiphilus]TCS78405.1 thioredoxin [Pectinatus cerevisiiphilus]
MPQLYTEQNFEKEVLQSSVPVLVHFRADWCVPCQKFAPIINEMEANALGKYKVGSVDVDKSRELIKRYNVNTIPTIIIFKNGRSAAQITGAVSREDLCHMMLND